VTLYDDIQAIECEEYRRLAVEDLAKSVTDPTNLARMDPDEAEEMRQYLGKLLGRPDDSLPELAKLLASKAKARVGLLQS
jgi:hypothetical protein